MSFIPVPMEVKMMMVVQEAALVARVVNHRLEATNVGVKQSRHSRLSHCVSIFFFLFLISFHSKIILFIPLDSVFCV